MHRRVFVAAASGILTGCVQFGDSPKSGPTGKENASQGRVGVTTDISREDAEELNLPYSVVDLRDVPLTVSSVNHTDEDSGASAVSALIEPSTNDSPAVLRSVVINRGEETTEVDTEEVPPYDGVGTAKGSGELYAVPTENHDLADGAPEVGRRDGETWRLLAETDPLEPLPRTVELEPGEGYVGEYAVVTDDGEIEEARHWFGEVRNPTDLFVTAWPTNSPGPEKESRFEGMETPDTVFGDTEVEALWYHEADETTPVYLEPSDERVELPATVGFRHLNNSREPSSEGGAGRYLYKIVDGELLSVFEGLSGDVIRRVFPGGRRTSNLRLIHGEPDADSKGLVIGHLGGGTYAYEWGSDHKGRRLMAMLELEAPPLGDVEPPEGVSSERDAGRVVVTTEAWDGTEEKDRTTATVRRVRGTEETDSDPELVIPEQLYTKDATGSIKEKLRYILPFFEETTEEVKLRANETTIDDLTDGGDTRVIRYRQDVYSVAP